MKRWLLRIALIVLALLLAIAAWHIAFKLQRLNQIERTEHMAGDCLGAIRQVVPTTSEPTSRQSAADNMRVLLARSDELAKFGIEIVDNTQFRQTNSEPLYGQYWVSRRGACFVLDEGFSVQGIALSPPPSSEMIVLYRDKTGRFRFANRN